MNAFYRFHGVNAGSKVLIGAWVLLLAACSSSSNDVGTDNPDITTSGYAVAALRSGFESGQLVRIDLDDLSATPVAYPATGSDITVASHGGAVYEIGQYLLDSITRYSLDDVTQPVYQYSVAGHSAGANPRDLVFVNDSDAFVVRYGDSEIWRVDPSAMLEQDFFKGSLSLAAYADPANGSAYASNGIVIGDKLFVVVQRLEDSQITRQGYLTVFDITTGEEIDTGKGEAEGLKGIPLGVTNPIGLHYSEADGLLYTLGRGAYWSVAEEGVERYTGGLVSIDPDTFDATVVLDDGTEADNHGGFFNQLLIDSPTKAYVVVYESWGSVGLRSLNLMTNSFNDGFVADLEQVDITTLAKDPDGRLWIGLNVLDNPGFRILNTTDDSVVEELVPTTLTPINIVFPDTE